MYVSIYTYVYYMSVYLCVDKENSANTELCDIMFLETWMN